MHSPNVRHVVSVSGGKDSLATALKTIEYGIDPIFVFADTGNEHPLTYDYLEYLEHALGKHITRVRADFSQQIANKRVFIAGDRRPKRHRSKGEWKRLRWSNKGKRRALEHLHATGNPFLDLGALKGRFPSRKASFCTHLLKRVPIFNGAQTPLLDQGYEVWSWQGVRRDESHARRNALEFEPDSMHDRLYSVRPLATWSAEDVFAMHRRHGIKPNPLYGLGFKRVGCMPCINSNKDEIFLILKLFPMVFDRVRAWEFHVGACSKRQVSTFFNAGKIPGLSQSPIRARIDNVIQWSKTTRGGQQFDAVKYLELADTFRERRLPG
jgi:3'-phosphoadenosine 5'-phosphosulfate sulfotransferase (PAPS reductase)/FAD synthetase